MESLIPENFRAATPEELLSNFCEYLDGLSFFKDAQHKADFEGHIVAFLEEIHG